MTYLAAADRYEQTPYRRCGRSGLKLPEVSLGLWQNFGDERPLDDQRRSSGVRSTWASPISTWPTTTGRGSAASYKLLNPAQRAAVAFALMTLAA
jgi:hypothetical protein